jgi:hypothetical protein
MGKVFYDTGFLAKAEVVECSATDLIGQYLGQTGPKVQKVLENALGRVLFIDEAYRLAEGPFAKEAMDEIVDCLTKEKFAQKLIVILAGYDQDINRLMAQNPGLTSRFPEAIVFTPLTPLDCVNLLVELLEGRKHDMKKRNKILDLSALEAPRSDFQKTLLDGFETLGSTSNWANARDIQTLAKAIFTKLIARGATRQQSVIVTEDDVVFALGSMISERSQREADGQVQQSTTASNPSLPQLPSRPVNRSHATAHSDSRSVASPKQTDMAATAEAQRDIGVSDAAWEQLQRDKAAALHREEEYHKLTKEISDKQREISKRQEVAETRLHQAAESNAEQAAIDEARRLRELARVQHELDRRAQQQILDELTRKREAEDEARKKDVEAQRKLKTMGVCPAGFRWTKQSGGYRCAGGFHFVTDRELGL